MAPQRLKLPSLRGKTVLITSGPTREHLDPIRYLTNASSGRMGAALASRALRLGARAWVVSGPAVAPLPKGARVFPVTSALQMYRQTLKLWRRADVLVGAAAVSDWRFTSMAPRKIKRGPSPLHLTLTPNPDIIKEVGRRRGRSRRPILVGFALETHEIRRFASEKLRRKGLDLVVANGPASLSRDSGSALILDRQGRGRSILGASKGRIAAAVFQEIRRFL
ncbi:MAG: phosphopantothenoylcysteine decarboxylase [Elusimicrobia bacterium]|nr:phosphopantothenoylcysteine decarboxylase [Elusimicrobiota bacterium]